MKKIPKVIVLIETSRAFGRDFISGITKYARQKGPWVFYREPRGLKFSTSHIKEWEADGIIMRNTSQELNYLDFKIPIINVLHYKRRENRIPLVKTECESISKLAAEHLIGLGYKNFGYCGFNNLDWSIERFNFFDQFISKAGYITQSFFRPEAETYTAWKKEQLLLAKWLTKLPKPVGIMACNDDRGHHVLEACKIADLRVPEDVAVLGVDNDTLVCEMCDPPLSSIALNTENAGYETAELLDKLMRNTEMTGQVILVAPTHVVSRHSTDIFSINDDNVVKALSFIYKNVRNKIMVEDIVKVTSLSRRSLETKFKKNLGRSIMEEVRRMRIEIISKLLIETDMSIAEICNTFSFIDMDHIARYFKKEKGIGLREFRKSGKNL
jgi:LacI family transcriptional regulator